LSSRDRQSRRAESGVVLGEISGFSEKLSVPHAVTDEATKICTRSLERGLSRGRLIHSITASSLYAACREKEVPITPDDVAAVSGVNRDDIAKCYRMIVRELNLKMPIADPSEYLPSVAYRANVSFNVESKAHEILSKARESGITAGAYPSGLAASALYLASMPEGERLTEKAAAEAAGVAESTVRNEIRRLRKALEAKSR
jgi:transcription initiation factor TFIIB